MSIRWRSQSEIQLHTSMVRPFSVTRESSIEIERGREKTVVLQLVIISVKVVLTIPLNCCDWMYRIFFYWNNLNFWHLNCLKKKKRNVECCEWTVPFIFSLSKHMTVCLEIWNTNQGCILRLLLRVLKNFLHGLLSYETEVIYLRVWFKGHQKRQNIWHFPSKWIFCCYFEKTPYGSYVT